LVLFGPRSRITSATSRGSPLLILAW
jgi:hypothetical protein